MLNRLKALLPFMLGVRAIIDNRFAAWFLVEGVDESVSP